MFSSKFHAVSSEAMRHKVCEAKPGSSRAAYMQSSRLPINDVRLQNGRPSTLPFKLACGPLPNALTATLSTLLHIEQVDGHQTESRSFHPVSDANHQGINWTHRHFSLDQTKWRFSQLLSYLLKELGNLDCEFGGMNIFQGLQDLVQ